MAERVSNLRIGKHEGISNHTEVNSVKDLNCSSKQLIVAFASMDGECIDQHFGSALGFYVFGIKQNDDVQFIASKEFPKEKKDGNEDKLKPKLSWLYGCDLVYCASIGASATRQLISLGIHPIVVKEGPDIEALLKDLQKELNGKITPLLARVLEAKKEKTERRFEKMDDEGWSE